MSRPMLLDMGIPGKLTHPRVAPDLGNWFISRSAAGDGFVVPEIADYELRRELLRMQSDRRIGKLDRLENEVGYLPTTTAAMRKAAEFWGLARRKDCPTAPDLALDADVILAGQAATLANDKNEVPVVTENVGHLARFVPAGEWRNL